MSNDTATPLIETDEEIEQRFLQSLRDEEAERHRQRKYQISKALQYQKNHPEQARLYSQRWSAKNPEKQVVYGQRRRARVKSLPFTWTEQEWLDCLDYWHNTCAVCGGQLRDLFGEVEPHADHWIPVSHPSCPGTVSDNMLPLCSGCNYSKHDTLPDEWLAGKFGAVKAAKILKRIHIYFELAR